LQDIAEDSGSACDDRPHIQVARAGFQGSGTEGISQPPDGGTQSIEMVSDAGDQWYKQENWSIALQRGGDPFAIPDDEDADEAATISPLERGITQHKLNNQLFAELDLSRHHPPRCKGFLPKQKLKELINPTAVIRELREKLRCPWGPSMTRRRSEDDIKKCAIRVCEEDEVDVGRGKKKIRSFRQVFAVLVLLDMPLYIWSFLDENVSDLDLPLVELKDPSSPRVAELRRRNSSLETAPEAKLRCFDGWPPSRVSDFYDYQWSMLAPYFKQAAYNYVPHCSLQDDHILPFIREEAEDGNVERGGGFSRVFMVRIHSAHHNFSDRAKCERGFAIKELVAHDSAASFKREVDILKKFCGDGANDHVVSLLSTYQHHDKYHLIFYRADGNLLDYWKKHPTPEVKRSSVLWMAKQCDGIAKALLRLHQYYSITTRDAIPDLEEEEKLIRQSSTTGTVKFVAPGGRDGGVARRNSKQTSTDPGGSTITASPIYENFNTAEEPQAVNRNSGRRERRAKMVTRPHTDSTRVRKYGRHGDLKPENILWYQDEEVGANGGKAKNTLKLSDFGTAEINSRYSKSREQSNVATTMTYRPPEADLQPKIRQSFDIWSLGCVYMEFATWMLGGYKLYREFGVERRSKDVFWHNMEADTFFEIVQDQNQVTGAMVKEGVTKVRPPSCCGFSPTADVARSGDSSSNAPRLGIIANQILPVLRPAAQASQLHRVLPRSPRPHPERYARGRAGQPAQDE